MIRSISLILLFLGPALTGFSQVRRIAVNPTPGIITTRFLSTGKYQSRQLERIIYNAESFFLLFRPGINLAAGIPHNVDTEHKHILDFHLKGWLKNDKTFSIDKNGGYLEGIAPLVEQLMHK
jgi:hypothetical protein